MILVIVFLMATLICFGMLLYNRTEKYKLLDEIGVDKIVKKIVSRMGDDVSKVRKRLTGGAKYDYGSDYDKIKQKRPIGSIRDTGENN